MNMGLFGLGKEVEIHSPESALMLVGYTVLFLDDSLEKDKIFI